MTRIKHQFLSQHKYAAVALPHSEVIKLKLDDPFELEQRDGSVVKVQYIDSYRFKAHELPDILTQLLFGINTQQMRVLLKNNYPDF